MEITSVFKLITLKLFDVNALLLYCTLYLAEFQEVFLFFAKYIEYLRKSVKKLSISITLKNHRIFKLLITNPNFTPRD